MSASKIHPTAVISSHSSLGQSVTVGPFAVIEDDVVIGDDCIIEAFAMIRSNVTLGSGNHVFPQSVIGGTPQDMSFDAETPSRVCIGDNNVFREGVTIHRATQEESATNIGSGNYLMNHAHVAHDCSLGNNTILASGVTLGGFVEVGDQVFMGGGVMVHQFCRIGALSMVRGLTGVSKDVIPYSLLGGFPVRHYRLNLVGLRRAGITQDRLKSLSAAFRNLRKSGQIGEVALTPETDHLKQWMDAASRRGVHPFV